MKVRFLKHAQLEVDNAVEWYNSKIYGLGTHFLDEIDRIIRRIVKYPLSSMKIENDIRRCQLSRFPYGIIYGVDSDTIIIIAVAHLHREPYYWIDRLI
jgi:hypothetical protein